MGETFSFHPIFCALLIPDAAKNPQNHTMEMRKSENSEKYESSDGDDSVPALQIMRAWEGFGNGNDKTLTIQNQQRTPPTKNAK